MNKHYDEFMKLFSKNLKDRCVTWSMDQIGKGTLTIPDLYSNILVPALYSIDDCPENNPGCIWDEHVKTSIVRTIIEALYPTVINLSEKSVRKHKKVVLICPEREYHEIGLRMMADFFQINGYEVIYVGSNTPRVQIWEVISTEKPDYVGISVTDYYLLSEAKKIIERIKNECSKDIKILLGGQAFRKNPHTVGDFGGDLYIENYDDILSLGKGEEK
jgi:methanogenic corrinoid protein MtbC1